MQGGLPAKPYGLLKKNFTLLLLSGRLMTQSQSSLELYLSGQPVDSTEPVTAVRSPHDGLKVGGCVVDGRVVGGCVVDGEVVGGAVVGVVVVEGLHDF